MGLSCIVLAAALPSFCGGVYGTAAPTEGESGRT